MIGRIKQTAGPVFIALLLSACTYPDQYIPGFSEDRTQYAPGYSEAGFVRVKVGDTRQQVENRLGSPLHKMWNAPLRLHYRTAAGKEFSVEVDDGEIDGVSDPDKAMDTSTIGREFRSTYDLYEAYGEPVRTEPVSETAPPTEEEWEYTYVYGTGHWLRTVVFDYRSGKALRVEKGYVD